MRYNKSKSMRKQFIIIVLISFILPLTAQTNNTAFSQKTPSEVYWEESFMENSPSENNFANQQHGTQRSAASSGWGDESGGIGTEASILDGYWILITCLLGYIGVKELRKRRVNKKSIV